MLISCLPPRPTKKERKLYLETYLILKWEIVKLGTVENTVSLSVSQNYAVWVFYPSLPSPDPYLLAVLLHSETPSLLLCPALALASADHGD